jgi:hypothetical protein
MNKDILNKLYYNNKRINREITDIKNYMNSNINCIISEEKQKEIEKINFTQIMKMAELYKRRRFILITVKVIGISLFVCSSVFGIKIIAPLFNHVFDILSLLFGY